MPVPPPQSLRIDRWLFYCRFYKTRGLATAAVTAGHARVNGDRAAPGHRLKPGDRVDLVRDRLPYTFEVVAIPPRRGPAPAARACYLEDQVVVREREEKSRALRQDRLAMPTTQGRPDKHTRRLLRERHRS